MTFASLLGDMVEDLPRCGEMLKLFTLRDTARRWCERVENLRRDTTPIDEVANTATYTLTSPLNGFLIRRVHAVTERGAPLKTHQYKYNVESRVLTLAAPPVDAYTGALVIGCVLVPPKFTAFELPPEYLDRWADAIVAGAKAKLMAQRGKFYSDRLGATDQRAAYNGYVAEACRELLLGGRVGALAMRPGRRWI